MKKSLFFLLFSLVLAMGKIAQGDAAVVLSYEQPGQAVVVDNAGNTFQPVYYDPAIGGADLYYWNGGRRVYVEQPYWGSVRVGYWHGHDHWHGGHDVHIHERVNIYEHGHRHH